MKQTLISILMSMCLYTVANESSPRVFVSSDKQVTLVELYSSEGCSSCPPADRWLGEFKNDPDLFKTFIPVAFQVDYWDYIGWKDPFADARYSKRQRDYARAGATSGVYTPGVLVNGREWRSWRRQSLPTQSDHAVGKLKLSAGASTVTVEFDNQLGGTTNLVANVALLGFGLASNIEAGENRGKRLSHEFVVLDWKKRNLASAKASFDFPEVSIPVGDLAIVGWVADADQRPVQAAGGWL